MDRERRNDGFTEVEDLYDGYEVYDRDGEKIGKVDDIFIDENDDPEYIGVKTGLFGFSSTLIPWDLAQVDEGRRAIEVRETKDKVKDAPNFDDDKAITPDFERRVRSHFGLGYEERERGGYDAYYSSAAGERFGATTGIGAGEHRPGAALGGSDRERSGFLGHNQRAEGITDPVDDVGYEDEIRVQRTEEELRAGTREREAGSVNVRKRVRTKREQIRVPKRREEVRVERMPVEGREALDAEIGDDDISVPVTEEEVVVEKRPVVKEEIRVRKDATQDEEIVEEDVRKEEVDIEDHTRRRDR